MDIIITRLDNSYTWREPEGENKGVSQKADEFSDIFEELDIEFTDEIKDQILGMKPTEVLEF